MFGSASDNLMARRLTFVSFFYMLYVAAAESDTNCEATGCAAKPRAANALLQHDTGIHEVEHSPQSENNLDKHSSLHEDSTASNSSQASQKAKRLEPLIKKVEVLNGEIGNLEEAVTKLEDSVGMAHTLDAAAPAAEGLLEQKKEEAFTKFEDGGVLIRAGASQPVGVNGLVEQRSSTSKTGARVQKKHQPSSAKRGFKIGLIEETQEEVDDELTQEETMKEEVQSLEQRMSSLTSHIENLENEVWGQLTKIALADTATMTGGKAGETSLKDRVLKLEYKVDNVKMRVAQLQHQVIG